MIIKECAYFLNEPEHVNSYGTCNLFPVKSRVETRFLHCECIPISKCPYKLFMLGKIDKEELNKRVKDAIEDAQCK